MQHVDLVSDDDDARDVKMAKRKERHLIEQAKARAMQRVDLFSDDGDEPGVKWAKRQERY